MPDTEIKEGSSQLMDPSSSEFQTMLASAKAKAEATLAVKVDTTAPEDKTQKDEKTPESSSEGTDKEDKADDDEELSDDVEKLKNQLRGVKAELSRVRNQKNSSTEEVSAMRDRIAKLEGRLEEAKENQESKSTTNSLKKLSDDKLFELHTSYEDELADARAVARQAERDNDRQAIAEANQRITDARKMLTALKKEQAVRTQENYQKSKQAEDENTAINTELETLFTEVFKAAPELADKNSDIWKAGQAEFKKLPATTKRLGALGELVATAAAIAKNPGLLGKKSTEKVLEKIEQVADKAFQRGGTAPRMGTTPEKYTINTQEDVATFEEQVRRVKMG